MTTTKTNYALAGAVLTAFLFSATAATRSVEASEASGAKTGGEKAASLEKTTREKAGGLKEAEHGGVVIRYTATPLPAGRAGVRVERKALQEKPLEIETKVELAYGRRRLAPGKYRLVILQREKSNELDLLVEALPKKTKKVKKLANDEKEKDAPAPLLKVPLREESSDAKRLALEVSCEPRSKGKRLRVSFFMGLRKWQANLRFIAKPGLPLDGE